MGDSRSELRRDWRRGGFTLVELLLVMALASMLAGAVVGMFVNSIDTFAAEQTRLLNQDDARLAMNQLTRYLRMATQSETRTDTRSDAVEVAQPSNVVFYADISGDGKADKVRYYVQGTNLRMQWVSPQWVTTPTPAHWSYPAFPTDGILITGELSGPTSMFRYFWYDKDEHTVSPLKELVNPTSFDDLEKIVEIEVSLEVNETPQFAPGRTRIGSRAQLRQRYQWGL